MNIRNTMPNDIRSLVEQIQAAHTGFELGNASSRQDLIWLSRKLVSSLEAPAESIQHMAYAEPAKFAQCRMAVDIGLFQYLEEQGDEGADVETLVKVTEVDPMVLTRILRHLAAMNVITELSRDHFASTPFSNALTDKRFEAGLRYLYDVSAPAHHAMPSYFSQNNYQPAQPQPKSEPDAHQSKKRKLSRASNGTKSLTGPFQFTHRTPLSFYSWLDASAGQYRPSFNLYMSAPRAGRLKWTDVSSFVKDTLINGFDPSISPVNVVDVAGGLGHELVALKTNFPSVPGKLVLQDRDEVISNLPKPGTSDCKSSPIFDSMAFDLFLPQPVKHARAYSLHSIMHDWNRAQCVQILKNVAAACKKGYSRVLIGDTIVPETGASWLVTSFDWQMMALAGARARTQPEWTEMLKEAGLRVVRWHLLKHSIEHLIEAEVI